MIQFDPMALSQSLLTVAEATLAAPDATAVVAQVVGDALQVSVAVGHVDRDHPSLAMAQSAYEIGSQTKMMTAVMILQLVQEGKIDLDAKAADYLPQASVDGLMNADQATVRQLLNMTSGIANYTEAVDENGQPLLVDALLAHPDQVFGPSEALEIARGMGPTGPVGGDYYYSNTNYLLLGEMVEGLTGQDFYDALQARVFDPSGMDHSRRQLQTGDQRLHSYAPDPATGTPLDVTRALWEMRGEAGVVSTNADMTAFLRALLVDKTLLGTEALAEMTDFITTDSGPAGHEDFGLGVSRFVLTSGATFVGFTGSTLATNSSTYLAEETGQILSVAGTSGDVNTVAAILQLWQDNQGGLWSQPAIQGAVEVTSVSAFQTQADRVAQGTVLMAVGAQLTLDRDIRSLTPNGLGFADGSLFLVGDRESGTSGDDLGNVIDIARQYAAAKGKDNHLMGLGGDDTLRGADGADRLDGGRGRDVLLGRSGDDDLRGGAGDDRLTGGTGDDRFSGGQGADVFVFTTAARETDTIRDFHSGIDLLDIKRLGNGLAWDWIGDQDFTSEAHQIQIRALAHQSRVAIDLDGDGAADLTLILRGHLTLGQSDFVI